MSSDMGYKANGPLIAVLKSELWREQQRIERAQDEMTRIKLELLELGVELPLQESVANDRHHAERVAR